MSWFPKGTCCSPGKLTRYNNSTYIPRCNKEHKNTTAQVVYYITHGLAPAFRPTTPPRTDTTPLTELQNKSTRCIYKTSAKSPPHPEIGSVVVSQQTAASLVAASVAAAPVNPKTAPHPRSPQHHLSRCYCQASTILTHFCSRLGFVLAKRGAGTRLQPAGSLVAPSLLPPTTSRTPRSNRR